MTVALRPTEEADLAFVVGLESAPGTAVFVAEGYEPLILMAKVDPALRDSGSAGSEP